MKTRNKWIACILLCLTVFAAVGCSADGLSYLAMQEKLLSLSSYRESGNVSFRLDAQIPSELEEDMAPMYLPSILHAIDDVNMDYDVQYCKGESMNRFCVRTANTSFDIDTFFTEDGTFISEIPTVAKAFLPKKYADAEYVALDTKEISESADETGETGVTLGGAMELSRSIYVFLKSYLPKAVSLPEIVSRSGNVYTIRISDENLKVILRELTNLYLTSEEARQDVNTLYEAVLSFYGAAYGEDFVSEIREGADEFFAMTDFESAKVMTDAFFDTLDAVPLLGEDGIVIKTAVDKNGYPQKAEAIVDLRIDMNYFKEISSGKPLYDEPFVISARLSTVAELSEINKIKQLDIPRTDGTKTVSLKEWTEERNLAGESVPYVNDDPDYIGNVELPAADGSITVFQHSYRRHFDGAKPRMTDGTLYVPVSFFTENYPVGCEVVDNTVFLYRYGKCYYAPVGSDVWETDFYSVDVRQPIIKADGEIYLPLRAVWESLNFGSVKWDETKNCVNVYSKYGY